MGGGTRTSETMIPPKLLVYRRALSDANLEALPATWRRKKSCGELFQKGYRVRQGHHRQEDGDKQPGPCHSVRSGLRVLLNWGKSVVIRVQTYVLVLWMLKHLTSVWFGLFCRNKLVVKHSEHLLVTLAGVKTHTHTHRRSCFAANTHSEGSVKLCKEARRQVSHCSAV